MRKTLPLSRSRAPDTHWIGGCMGPTDGLDTVEKRKICCPCPGSNPSHTAYSPMLYQLSYEVLGTEKHNGAGIISKKINTQRKKSHFTATKMHHGY
jgi:hypothetical protein